MTEGCRNRLGGRAERRDRGAAGWRKALAASALLILTPLAACERQAYDAPTSAVAPPPPTPQPLSGAPVAPSYPDAPPPPMDAPSAAPNPYAPPPPPSATGAPTAIVAMEPIPNPPEGSARTHLRREPPPRPLPRRYRHRRHVDAYRPRATPAGVAPARAMRRPRSVVKPARHATTAATPTVTGNTTKAAHAASTTVTSNANANSTGGDRSRNVAELQGVLADAVQKTAVLSPSTRLSSDKPIEVTLTLPADFADTVRTESGRRGLSEAAASVNVSALLSGDDYKATPDDAQTQPLLSGQPTRFHWTVLGQGAARGPLHAELKAQLLGGGGDTLDLGSVTASDHVPSGWRALGVVLLALIGLAIVAALGRRKARARAQGVVTRPMPFDMNSPG